MNRPNTLLLAAALGLAVGCTNATQPDQTTSSASAVSFQDRIRAQLLYMSPFVQVGRPEGDEFEQLSLSSGSDGDRVVWTTCTGDPGGSPRCRPDGRTGTFQVEVGIILHHELRFTDDATGHELYFDVELPNLISPDGVHLVPLASVLTPDPSRPPNACATDPTQPQCQ